MVIWGLSMGDQTAAERVSAGPVVADTFAGRIHLERDDAATATLFGQMLFYSERY